MWTGKYWNPRYWTTKYWTRPTFTPTPIPGVAGHADWARNIVTGWPAGGAEIAVRNHATDTLSTIFEADGLTLKPNPFMAELETGRYGWLAINGRYDETVTPRAGGGETYTNPDILVYNPGV